MAHKKSHGERVLREQLPTTLFPVLTVRIDEHDPAELDLLCAQQQRLAKLPAGLSLPRRRQLCGLAQYRGRSAEGNRKSLLNLRRRIPNELILGENG